MDHGYLDDKGEYIGDYEGCRVNCSNCKFSCFEIGLDEYHKHCDVLNIEIHESNNVCNQFQSAIGSKHFDYDAYFEWLMNEYYRPYKSSGEIIGSGKLGEAILDGGKLADLLPNVYSYWYGTVDLLRCTIHTPDCNVYIGKHGFTIDYRKFKNLSFLNGDELNYKVHYFKEKKTSKKYISDYYGKININKLEVK